MIKPAAFLPPAQQPNAPINAFDLEKEAEKRIHSGPFGYIQSGAGGEETLRKNRTAFEKYSLIPQFLQNVSTIDTSITLFGKTYPHPFLFAPIGMNRLAHPDGELASSQAAASYGIPYIQSTVSSYSIEDIAQKTSTSPKWFQLYWSSDQNIALNMAKRAEKAGYEAIVLTIDTVIMGWRERDMRTQFSPLKLGYATGNFLSDSVFLKGIKDPKNLDEVVQGILSSILHPTLSWDNIARLRETVQLPILLKGVLHPNDAKQALAHGIDGIIVSNHGGRQLDGVIASLDALPAITEAVQGQIPILLDSGIRRGSDVLKALALGADAVLLGRPYIYALAYDGQAGIERFLENFIYEIRVSMGLVGASSTQAVKHCAIRKEPMT